MRKWRPEEWKTPNVFALKDCKANQCVTSEDLRYIGKEEQEAFEAGADKMLEALRKQGDKEISNFISKQVEVVLQIPYKKGLWFFIPDEE